EHWIAEGKPLQLAPEAIRKGTRPKTALQIVLETGQHSLASLLLKSGYRLECGFRPNPAGVALGPLRSPPPSWRAPQRQRIGHGHLHGGYSVHAARLERSFHVSIPSGHFTYPQQTVRAGLTADTFDG